MIKHVLNPEGTPGRLIQRVLPGIILICLIIDPGIGNQDTDRTTVQQPFQTVSRQDLVRAFKIQAEKGYDLTAITNGPRMHAEVLLQLVQWSRKSDRQRKPLFIDHQDYFDAYLTATGLSAAEAPLFTRLAYEHRQDLLIEYRPDQVIREVSEGPQPELVASVTAWWPDSGGLPAKYSYIDTLSIPQLKVTNHRLIYYRLIDFGNMILYDDIEGVTGRPLNGILALLFKVVGEGQVVQSRSMISEDGLQITRAEAKKGIFSVTSTVTVYPDGRVEKDVPGDRADLLKIDQLLKQPLKVAYKPPLPPATS